VYSRYVLKYESCSAAVQEKTWMAATQYLLAFATRNEQSVEDCEKTGLGRWQEITAKLLVIADIRQQKEDEKAPKFIPPDGIAFFDKLEADHGLRFDAERRLRCYFEYCQHTSDYGVIEASKVPPLLEKLEIKVSTARLNDIMGHILFSKSSLDFFMDEGYEDGLSFKSFVSLIAQILLAPEDEEYDRQSSIPCFRHLPLDPDSQGKQTWDAWCLLLLLYCSFAVPYNIAFDSGSSGGGLTTTDYVDVLINTMFMIDIALTFITAYDKQGCLVTDYRKIAENYLKSWFFLDVAGSFPFDQVISLALEANGQGSSSNLSAIKLIRMLKLVRALKFLNKLNRLKEKEGFEMLGSFIGVSSALFIIIFVSHLVGCMYIMVASMEPAGENWLDHYSPQIAADPDDWPRYVTALYWAAVTVTTMGYGDILPVTHTERMISIGVALTGAIVFSHCMGLVSSLIAQAGRPLPTRAASHPGTTRARHRRARPRARPPLRTPISASEPPPPPPPSVAFQPAHSPTAPPSAAAAGHERRRPVPGQGARRRRVPAGPPAPRSRAMACGSSGPRELSPSRARGGAP
jgi:hypothetical protein